MRAKGGGEGKRFLSGLCSLSACRWGYIRNAKVGVSSVKQVGN